MFNFNNKHSSFLCEWSKNVCIPRRGGFFKKCFWQINHSERDLCVHVTHGCNLATPGSACVIEISVAFSDPASLFIDFTRISVNERFITLQNCEQITVFVCSRQQVCLVANEVSSSPNICWNLNLIKRYLKLEEWVFIVWSIVCGKEAVIPRGHQQRPLIQK